MSQLTSSASGAVDSILACVNCARSKAKCDRKIPCSRCRLKKLTCQTRVPQRGQGRSSATNGPKAPSSTNTTREDRESVESELITHTTDGEPKRAPKDHPVANGLYMDWSHPVSHKWARGRPRSTSEAEQVEDAFAQFAVAAPRIDRSHIPDLSPFLHPIQAGNFGLADDFDFVVPTQVPSPLSQLPQDMSGPPSWNLAFTISPGPLARSSTRDGDETMEDYLPDSSLIHSREDSVPKYDQLHTLEGWPLFQCNPITSSSVCASTAANHVKSLESLLGGGNIPIPQSRVLDSHTVVESLLASTRERLIAALQWLFTEAQQLYGPRGQDTRGFSCSRPSIVVLHPPAVLDSLLRAYLTSYEPYYPFIPMTTLNERMEGQNTIWPSMALFLMLAGGGMTAGAGDACVQLAHGLLEICRVSLRNLSEQKVGLALDHEVSQCTLLNILVSAWSGDKWQMDTAFYQKPMFLEMHLKAKHHDHREAQVGRIKAFDDVTQSWETWKDQERANRTTHAWLILDHEMCLFQDAPSVSFLSSAALSTPIPSPYAAWQARSAKHWIERMSSSSGEVIVPPSLGEWIGWFSETNTFSSTSHMSPITLRLLLCHLQNQVIQLRSAMDTVAGRGGAQKGSQHMSIVLLSLQVQGVQELLEKWYKLAKAQKPNETATPATASNMMLYHLIMLNVLVSFPEIERLARSGRDTERTTDPSRPFRNIRAYHLENRKQIYFHCGQVLRHVRSVPEPARPPWWAGAVYRVALITWANGLASADGNNVQNQGVMDTQATVALDMLTPDHASVLSYLNQEGHIPVFADLSGATVALDNSVGILQHFARFLDTDIKTKFTSGVQRKLSILAHRWESGIPNTLPFTI